MVRTLKLVLREFQRRWMKSEQSSSERVRVRTAKLHALVLVLRCKLLPQQLLLQAVAAAAAAAVEVHIVAVTFWCCYKLLLLVLMSLLVRKTRG